MTPALIVLLIVATCTNVHCQAPGDDALQCNATVNSFKMDVSCQFTYEDIAVRGCGFGRDMILCQGVCGERAKSISCACHDNQIVNDIGGLCNCTSNITCSLPTDNCSRAVYAFSKECGSAYSTLRSNISCPACCSSLCSPECSMLAKNISCYCSKMSEGGQIIESIDSLCECPTEHCNSSATDLLLLPWILILSISIATWWISQT